MWNTLGVGGGDSRRMMMEIPGLGIPVPQNGGLAPVRVKSIVTQTDKRMGMQVGL